MVNHKKPTKAELDADVKRLLEESEKLPTEDPEDPTPTPAPAPEPKPTPSEPNPEPSKPKDEPEPTPQPEEEPEEEPSPSQPDPSKEFFKKKFKDSSRGAQKLYGANKVFDSAVDSIETMPEPTDEETRAEFDISEDDWEMMNKTEVVIAKEAVKSRKFREIIQSARQEAKKIEGWEKDVDKYVEDPKTLTEYPDLEGKQESFKEFAKQDENKFAPYKLLVSAFLHDAGKKVVKNKGQMFESGGGGPIVKDKPKSDKISLADAEVLKKNNYKKYKELLLANKIADE